jgi:hypothetical protein
MTRHRTVTACLAALFSLGLTSAWAFVVTDPATTARNAVTAVLTTRIVDIVTDQSRRLRRMAERLSALTSLDKFVVVDPENPRWRAYRYQDVNLYANPYVEALNHGDPDGTAYAKVSRARAVAGPELASLGSPAAIAAIGAQLATLDLADSTLINGTHLDGQLRPGSKREMLATDALERDVLDPSPMRSATAVLDTISAAVLIETRQQQSRLQFLTALVEQLLVDNKRARDTEATAMNMQLRRLMADPGEGGGVLSGASRHLRTWRQP